MPAPFCKAANHPLHLASSLFVLVDFTQQLMQPLLASLNKQVYLG